MPLVEEVVLTLNTEDSEEELEQQINRKKGRKQKESGRKGGKGKVEKWEKYENELFEDVPVSHFLDGERTRVVWTPASLKTIMAWCAQTSAQRTVKVKDVDPLLSKLGYDRFEDPQVKAFVAKKVRDCVYNSLTGPRLADAVTHYKDSVSSKWTTKWAAWPAELWCDPNWDGNTKLPDKQALVVKQQLHSLSEHQLQVLRACAKLKVPVKKLARAEEPTLVDTLDDTDSQGHTYHVDAPLDYGEHRAATGTKGNRTVLSDDADQHSSSQRPRQEQLPAPRLHEVNKASLLGPPLAVTSTNLPSTSSRYLDVNNAVYKDVGDELSAIFYPPVRGQDENNTGARLAKPGHDAQHANKQNVKPVSYRRRADGRKDDSPFGNKSPLDVERPNLGPMTPPQSSFRELPKLQPQPQRYPNVARLPTLRSHGGRLYAQPPPQSRDGVHSQQLSPAQEWLAGATWKP